MGNENFPALKVGFSIYNPLFYDHVDDINFYYIYQMKSRIPQTAHWRMLSR
jgi:hypothetical protein